MPKVKNAAWRFFASVKLALISLFILAVTSIIGTLVKQGQDAFFYVQEYGPTMARVFEVLDISDMYSSWWYVTLLCLFGINLVVCTIERLPRVWGMVKMDNLIIDPGKLEKMRFLHRTDICLEKYAAAEKMSQCMIQAGWKRTRRLDQGNSILLFAQKGAWTRLSVYLVHLSVLIILIGGLLSSFFGIKAYVYLSEGRATSNIFLQSTREAFPLGFELQNNRFERTFYPNGMIKQFRTELTVFDPAREKPYHKSIIVNDPLSYRGFTFYQADSYPLEEFFVKIQNHTNHKEQAFRVPPQKNVSWKESGISFEIVELKQDREEAVQQAGIRITFDDATEPLLVRVLDNGTATIQDSGHQFTIAFKQYYTTLLLVARDPGVLIVYLGCIMMLSGLAVSFFLSHQRIWLRITTKEDEGSSILVSGTNNKNRPAFAKRFQELIARLGQEELIDTATSDI